MNNTTTQTNQLDSAILTVLSRLTCLDKLSPAQRESIDLRYGRAMDAATNDADELAIANEVLHQLSHLEQASD